MSTTRYWRSVGTVCVVLGLALLLAACEGDDGDPGPPGAAGYSCWDTNANGIADPATEDVNRDGRVDVQDCRGQDGQNGEDGRDGEDGLSCWDINKNGRPDLDVEDRNQDGIVDVEDCQGQDGQPGLHCWDLNANGVADLPAEDTNGDGVVDGADCRGQDGQDGVDGEDGLHCWDLNANGVADLPEEDVNGDGTVTVADCSGLSFGSLVVEVVDAQTRAPLGSGQGGFDPATVEIDPPVAPPTATDALGRVSLRRLPAGVYTITASARALMLDGSIVSESDQEAWSSPATRSIVAGSSNFLRLEVSRVPPTMPLTALHDSSWAAGAAYTEANCTICHGDKRNEGSRDPTVPRWHATTDAQGEAVHVSAGCVFCHEGRVDLAERSVPSLRRQVAITKCTMCHRNYPSLP